MSYTTRRDFLKTSVAASILSGFSRTSVAQTTKRSVTDWVTLVKSNVKVTQLAFGTGTHGGCLQTVNRGAETRNDQPPLRASLRGR